MTNQQAIKQFLVNLTKDIKADQVGKDIRASGASARSLRSEVFKDRGILYGFGYFEQQTWGRKPGKFPPIEDILQWIKAKKIQSDISEKSLAFLIARKIARYGTDIYQGKRPGLDFKEILDINMEELMQNLADGVITDIKNILNKELPNALPNEGSN